MLVGGEHEWGDGALALDDAKGALFKIGAHVFGIEPIDAGSHGAAASMAYGEDIERVSVNILPARIEREQLPFAREQQTTAFGCSVAMVAGIFDQCVAIRLCGVQRGEDDGFVGAERDDIDARIGKCPDKKPLQRFGGKIIDIGSTHALFAHDTPRLVFQN